MIKMIKCWCWSDNQTINDAVLINAESINKAAETFVLSRERKLELKICGYPVLSLVPLPSRGERQLILENVNVVAEGSWWQTVIEVKINIKSSLTSRAISMPRNQGTGFFKRLYRRFLLRNK